MKVTILGNSDGVQTKESGNTSLLLQSENTSILIDVSGSPCSLLLRAGINPVDLNALVLTHAHVDHIYGFPSLIHNLWLLKRKTPLFVYGNFHTIEKAKSLLSIFHLDEKKDMMKIVFLEEIGEIGSIKITGFFLEHRPLVPTCGFTFKDKNSIISYFPDSVVGSILPACAQYSDIIIHEAHGLQSQEKELAMAGHSSGRMAADVALRTESKKLILIHLPGDFKLQKEILLEASSLYPNTIIAGKMKEYSI